ncbi:hypothetical protein SSX86_031144 [Deinandra increscens subsp. villosa]|uniref:Wall-associated receptor kinase galacturonan-binding domain-containing protein n=1 Tax=Deinandra increscens subsp. villosa TaxID=3103831 RepID=A0AAP0GIJ1_9ASTR
MMVGALQGATTIPQYNIAKPECATQCGGVTVPYPFGIGTDCSFNHSFIVSCDTSYEPPKLFLGDSNIRIYSISELELRIATIVSYNCYNESGHIDGYTVSIDLRPVAELTFSEKNRFTVIGCDDYAFVTGTEKDDFTGGCFGLCSKAPNMRYGQCSGIGCCELLIPKGLSFYNATLKTINNHADVWTFNECSYGFLVEEGSFKFGVATNIHTNYLDFMERIGSTMPIVVDWVIAPEGNCSTVEVNGCKENSSCYDVEGGGRSWKAEDDVAVAQSFVNVAHNWNDGRRPNEFWNAVIDDFKRRRGVFLNGNFIRAKWWDLQSKARTFNDIYVRLERQYGAEGISSVLRRSLSEYKTEYGKSFIYAGVWAFLRPYINNPEDPIFTFNSYI